MTERMIFAGFGGQGLITAGKLVGACAMAEGKHVTYFPSYGGEVRGGTTNCQVVLSDAPIASPLIEECPVSLECKIVSVAHLGSHDWVMGEAVAVHVDEELLDGDRIAYDRTNPVFSFFTEYWSVGEKICDWHGAVRK